jgi:hypothetical protein
MEADMPDTGLSRKQIAGRLIRCVKGGKHLSATPIKGCVPFVQHLPETSA